MGAAAEAGVTDAHVPMVQPLQTSFYTMIFLLALLLTAVMAPKHNRPTASAVLTAVSAVMTKLPYPAAVLALKT